jgi:hypothetical protein
MQAYNKAWVALAGIVIEVALLVFGADLGLTDEALAQIITAVTALTGVGVYQVPNKPKEE